jgi:hypothetical protein
MSELTFTLRKHSTLVTKFCCLSFVLWGFSVVFIPSFVFATAIIVAMLLGIRLGYALSIIESNANDKVQNNLFDGG